MRPPYRLRKRRTNIHNPQFITPLPLITQGHRIRHHDRTKTTIIQGLYSIPAQNAMGDDGDDFAGAVRHYGFGGFYQSAAGIGHVVDEDGGFGGYVADERHAGDFVGARAFFVDYCEAEVEAVGDGGCSVVSSISKS